MDSSTMQKKTESRRVKTSIEICMTNTPVQCDLTFDLTSQIRLQEIDSDFVYNPPINISSIANPHDKSLDHLTMCYTLSHSQTQFVFFLRFFFSLSSLILPFSIFSSFDITSSINDTHTHTHTRTHTHTTHHKRPHSLSSTDLP